MERNSTSIKIERAIVLVICGAVPLVPILFHQDAGYCQRPQMATSTTSYTCYTIYAPNGQQVPQSQFGLADHQLPARLRANSAKTLPLATGQKDQQELVSLRVAEQLADFPELPFVIVLRRVIGDRDGRTVDVLKARSWVVINPVSTVDPDAIPSTACAG